MGRRKEEEKKIDPVTGAKTVFLVFRGLNPVRSIYKLTMSQGRFS